MTSDHAPTRPESRPLSPHLQIWRWTPTMAASITHRATGVALYAGTILLATWAFAASRGAAFYEPVGAFLASPLGVLILFGYVWALMFHAINGLRHLYWDMGRGLDVKTAAMTAWFAYAASILLAIVIVAAGVAAGVAARS
jgi:succinate dehydrogenase / fumarate reductase cytochrome b subunit